MDEFQELVDSLVPVVSALRKLGIRHYVGGSVASSFHGPTRSTMDVDLVCELTERDISQFIELIGVDYYVSEPAMREAVQQKKCCNLIHLPTELMPLRGLRGGWWFSIEKRTTARQT